MTYTIYNLPMKNADNIRCPVCNIYCKYVRGTSTNVCFCHSTCVHYIKHNQFMNVLTRWYLEYNGNVLTYYPNNLDPDIQTLMIVNGIDIINTDSPVNVSLNKIECFVKQAAELQLKREKLECIS